MIELMVLLVFALALLACSVIGVVRAGRREVGYLRARRGGVELQATVTDSQATPSGRSGAYNLAPTVRYRLGERSYEATVVNAASVPRNRGDAMTVVVSPDSPYEPYDRYQGMGTQARNLILLFGLAVVVLLIALARL
jgi:Protein of unknown function (DUF3592)